MELLRISENKLKVSLSAADMAAYELRCDEFDYQNTKTRRVFWNILDRAREETGFDAAAERVLVQVFPSVCGGCELFVTKVGAVAGSGEHRLMQHLKNTGEARSCLQAWRFAELEMLLRGCKCLADLPQLLGSSVYLLEDRRGYALFFTFRETCGDTLWLPALTPYDMLRDFGEKLDAAAALLHTMEHGRLLVDGTAVQTLAPIGR